MQSALLMCKWVNVSEQNTLEKSKFWIWLGQIMVDWTENILHLSSDGHKIKILFDGKLL